MKYLKMNLIVGFVIALPSLAATKAPSPNTELKPNQRIGDAGSKMEKEFSKVPPNSLIQFSCYQGSCQGVYKGMIEDKNGNKQYIVADPVEISKNKAATDEIKVVRQVVKKPENAGLDSKTRDGGGTPVKNHDQNSKAAPMPSSNVGSNFRSGAIDGAVTGGVIWGLNLLYTPSPETRARQEQIQRAAIESGVSRDAQIQKGNDMAVEFIAHSESYMNQMQLKADSYVEILKNANQTIDGSPNFVEIAELGIRNDAIMLWESLYKFSPSTRRENNLRSMGLAAVKVGASQAISQAHYNALVLLDFARTVLGSLAGYHPVMGPVINLYVVLNGRDFTTNLPVTSFERTLAVAGLMMLLAAPGQAVGGIFVIEIISKLKSVYDMYAGLENLQQPVPAIRAPFPSGN